MRGEVRGERLHEAAGADPADAWVDTRHDAPKAVGFNEAAGADPADAVRIVSCRDFGVNLLQ